MAEFLRKYIGYVLWISSWMKKKHTGAKLTVLEETTSVFIYFINSNRNKIFEYSGCGFFCMSFFSLTAVIANSWSFPVFK
jgi:hypothetical protein